MPAKPLTLEQLEDSKRFKIAYVVWSQTRQDAELKGSQEEAAALLEISQASFNDYCNGQIPLNLTLLVKALAKLDINPKYVSPTIYSQMVYIAEQIKYQPGVQSAFNSHKSLVSRTPFLASLSPEARKLTEQNIARFQHGLNPELEEFANLIESDVEAVEQFRTTFSVLNDMDCINWMDRPSQKISYHKCLTHLEQMDIDMSHENIDAETYLIFIKNPSSVSFQIGWIDANNKKIRWKEWDFPVHNAVFAYLEVADLFDKCEYYYQR